MLARDPRAALRLARAAKHGRAVRDVILYALACALCAAMLATALGCVSVTVEPDRVHVHALGQVSVAAGCPAVARPERGGTAEAGDGGDADAGSPCVAIQGASISSTMGNAIAALLGLLSASLIP